MKNRRFSLCRACGVSAALVLTAFATAEGAVKERAYTFDDAGAVAGQLPPLLTAFNRRGTDDSAPSTTDFGGVDTNPVNNSLVPLIGSGNTARIPVYASASDRPGASAGNFGLLFDGVDDSLYNPTPPAAATTPYLFDPRDFGQFDTLSQAWVKPTSASLTAQQFIWRIGNENGGATITAEGKWALRTGNPSATVPLEDVEVSSSIDVALNDWTHVAVFRGGNFSFLYIDGSLAAMNPGFWGQDGPEVRLGADILAAGLFFQGVVDNFNIGTASDGVFDPETDLDYYTDQNITFSGVAGDINQDGAVNQADYDIWSENVGFDNGFGVGDPSTLLMGDADQSGVIDLFDFQLINQAALNPPPGSGANAGIPEPGAIALVPLGLGLLWLQRARVRWSVAVRRTDVAMCVAIVVTLACAGPAMAVVVVADDFLYDGPTKELHVGGGFNGFQQYEGGQSGSAGNWVGQWGQVGDGVVATPDFTPPIDPFTGLPEVTQYLSPHVAMHDGFFGVQSELFRDFALGGSVGPTQTLYFGGRFRADLDIGTDGNTVTQYYAPRLFLNRVAGDDRYFDINGVPVDPQRDRSQDIGLGFESFRNINTALVENTVVARLGGGLETKATVTGTPPNDGNWHQIVGKLEVNVSGGANERLTVWIDPTGVETGGASVQVQADILSDLTGLVGTLHSQGTRPLNPTGDPTFPIDPADSLIENTAELGRSYIDDVAIGTAWQDVAAVNVPRLTLRINRTSGAGTLVNNSSAPFQLNGYSIESEAGSLNGTGWNSLDEQNVGNWLQNRATANQLVETFFTGSTTVPAGGQLALGNLFNVGGMEDVAGRFSTADSLVNLLQVQFVSTVGVQGDYNNNGTVDAADYVLWRNGGPLMNEGATPGSVTPEDYTFWRSRFGMTSGAGSGGIAANSVPEPTTWFLGLLATILAVTSRGKGNSNR